MDTKFPPPIGWKRPSGNRVPESMAQKSLLPLRFRTIYPHLTNGADLSFVCEAEVGGTFYCKDDKSGRSIRSTEWFCTRLASHVGILTADCAVMESAEDGKTYFGSLSHLSTASMFEVRDFLTQPHKGELGQPSEWPGRYLSSLYALDLFLNNPDRGISNFLMRVDGMSRLLCAIDFAAVRLGDLSTRNFLVATDPTVSVGKLLRRLHGFFRDSAFEMIDRIAAIPRDTVRGFLREMPDEWMVAEQREGISDLWSEKRLGGRLMALRTGIADESLL